MSARQRNPAESESKKAAIAGKSKGPKAAQKASQISREEQFERQGVISALEAGLHGAMPGLEVLDRNLEFDDRVRADLAVVDPRGRLLLVLVAREDPQAAILETLDVLAYLRQNALLLMRHLNSRQVDDRLEPRVVLIDSSNDSLLAERLLPLAIAGVRIFGVRTLKGSGSECSYLVPCGEELVQPEDPELGIQSFLDALPTQLRELGTSLTERLKGLDDQLMATCDEKSLIWRWNGFVIARLECLSEGLRASVAPNHKSISITGHDHVESLLEQALVCLMDEYERSVEETRDLPAGLGSMPNKVMEPLLSDDEIRAFHS